MYRLVFDEKAMQFLEKLPNKIGKRIFRKIQDTKINPHHYFVRLSNRKEYKLRVGDYRVIADIKDNKLIILIIHIGHRSKIYKKI